MKRTLSLILSLLMVLSCFTGLSITSSAQVCAWTLYVNGTQYPAKPSYQETRPLKFDGTTVTMNNFYGQSIVSRSQRKL